MIRNERGYALILVMFMVVIFLILGTAVMGATIGGATRTEKREDDVQSLHLAEKTLDEAVAYLVSQYDGEVVAPEDLAILMQQVKLDELKLKLTSTRLNGAEGKITDITADPLADDHTSYSVKLTAEATINGTKRTLQQEVIINSYPEFLNYAFGSENDVIINGSVYSPRGSVYAGGELKIDNWADYIYLTTDRFVKSTYPRLDLGDSNRVFVQSLDAIQVHDSTSIIPRGRGPEAYTALLGPGNPSINELLGIGNQQIQIRNNKKFVSIDVVETFVDKVMEATGSSVGRTDIKAAVEDIMQNGNLSAFSNRLVSNGVFKMGVPPLKPNPPLDLNDAVLMDQYEEDMDGYNMYISQFSSISDSTLFDGDLELDGIEYKTLDFTDDAQRRESGGVEWFIVNGDLRIINYNPDLDEKLTIKGNILVTGDVVISGNVQVDATMYTLGTTTLEDGIIRGIESGGQRKQLMLISKGKIFIHRVDAPNNYGSYSANNPNTIDAFFYTDDAAELYGVGSVFWLHGGFFSKGTLTINAVRGNVTDTGSDFSFHITEDDRDKDQSRFVIEYYEGFFDTQSSALPRVDQLSVQAGSRKLISNP